MKRGLYEGRREGGSLNFGIVCLVEMKVFKMMVCYSLFHWFGSYCCIFLLSLIMTGKWVFVSVASDIESLRGAWRGSGGARRGMRRGGGKMVWRNSGTILILIMFKSSLSACHPDSFGTLLNAERGTQNELYHPTQATRRRVPRPFFIHDPFETEPKIHSTHKLNNPPSSTITS